MDTHPDPVERMPTLSCSNASVTLVRKDYRFPTVDDIFHDPAGLSLDSTTREIVLADPTVLSCPQLKVFYWWLTYIRKYCNQLKVLTFVTADDSLWASYYDLADVADYTNTEQSDASVEQKEKSGQLESNVEVRPLFRVQKANFLHDRFILVLAENKICKYILGYGFFIIGAPMWHNDCKTRQQLEDGQWLDTCERGYPCNHMFDKTCCAENDGCLAPRGWVHRGDNTLKPTTVVQLEWIDDHLRSLQPPQDCEHLFKYFKSFVAEGTLGS